VEAEGFATVLGLKAFGSVAVAGGVVDGGIDVDKAYGGHQHHGVPRYAGEYGASGGEREAEEEHLFTAYPVGEEAGRYSEEGLAEGRYGGYEAKLL